MDVPPIGAGAGDTGGANAIGQLLATGSAKPAAAEYSGRGMPLGYGTGDGAPVEPETLPQGFLLIVEDASTKASPSSPIFLACNWNNWNPSDPAFRLEPQSDMRWRILVKRPEGRTDRLEFKFTRGDWALEELNDDLGVTLVIVTHDPALARRARRNIKLVDGLVVHDGPALEGY